MKIKAFENIKSDSEPHTNGDIDPITLFETHTQPIKVNEFNLDLDAELLYNIALSNYVIAAQMNELLKIVRKIRIPGMFLKNPRGS